MKAFDYFVWVLPKDSSKSDIFERESERYIDRKRETEREREREADPRDTERDRERERYIDRKRETERERERPSRGPLPYMVLYVVIHGPVRRSGRDEGVRPRTGCHALWDGGREDPRTPSLQASEK